MGSEPDPQFPQENPTLDDIYSTEPRSKDTNEDLPIEAILLGRNHSHWIVTIREQQLDRFDGP